MKGSGQCNAEKFQVNVLKKIYQKGGGSSERGKRVGTEMNGKKD